MPGGEPNGGGSDGDVLTAGGQSPTVTRAPDRDVGDIHVLHVDDEPALLDVTEQYLQREDDRITVETATAAQAGLDHLDARSFDVVVSDYQMPGMDGLEFLQRVRDDGRPIPFIVFTGKSREAVAVEALNLGADRYLQKGGDPESQYGLLADAIVQEAVHRRAQATLRESEQRYRTLVEALPDIVFITDYDSRMLWANGALERQTGLTVEDFQMHQEENPFIHPDDAARVAERIGAFVESDRTYSEPIDNRFIDADGDVHWYSSIVGKVTYEGQPALQFIVRNISERKRRERRLQRVERRYRTLVEAFPEGIVALFDDDLTFLDVGGDAIAEIAAGPADVEGLSVERVDVGPFASVSVDDCRAVLDGNSHVDTHEGEVGWDLYFQPVIDDDPTAGFVVALPPSRRTRDAQC